MHLRVDTKLRCSEVYVKIIDLLDLTGANPKQIYLMIILCQRIRKNLEETASNDVIRVFEKVRRQIKDLKR